MLCFVLQRTPTNENNGGTEWRGIQQLPACDVDDEVEVEQISGTNRALKKMKTAFLGPIGLNIRLGCSLGRMRTRNGEATPTKVNQTDNCE